MTQSLRLALALAFSIVALSAAPLPVRAADAPASAPAAVAQKQKAKRAARGDATLLQAKKQITAIKARLEAAPKEFGGHKATAIQHLNEALQEIDAALKADSTAAKK